MKCEFNLIDPQFQWDKLEHILNSLCRMQMHKPFFKFQITVHLLGEKREHFWMLNMAKLTKVSK